MVKRSIIFFLIGVLFVSTVTVTHAQEASPSATPTPVAYTLPYPGILPGQPFYFLKDLRDKIVGFFISQPIKRAEYDLLQADKKMQATLLLFTQAQKEELAFETLTTAEDSFAHAINQTKEAKQQGLATDDIRKTLLTANAKYQEVLHELLSGATGQTAKKLSQHLQVILELDKQVKNLDH